MRFTTLSQVKHPKRSNPTDAGIDFFIPDLWNNGEPFILEPGRDIKIPLGIRVEVPYGWALIFMNKSGVSLNQKLSVGACVIDPGYEGEVHAHMFNYTNEASILIEPGKKIVQGLLIQVDMGELHHVNSIEDISTRGAGGFGSTGL